MIDKNKFNLELIRSYPHSNKKVNVEVEPYSLPKENEKEHEGHKAKTIFLSPHGLEFTCSEDFEHGTILKILIDIPDYWQRKQKYVDYKRIDTPQKLKILAKVVKTTDQAKRSKKKVTLVQTVNIDDVDEQVLKTFLEE
jgi:hypothetical protein